MACQKEERWEGEGVRQGGEKRLHQGKRRGEIHMQRCRSGLTKGRGRCFHKGVRGRCDIILKGNGQGSSGVASPARALPHGTREAHQLTPLPLVLSWLTLPIPPTPGRGTKRQATEEEERFRAESRPERLALEIRSGGSA